MMTDGSTNDQMLIDRYAQDHIPSSVSFVLLRCLPASFRLQSFPSISRSLDLSHIDSVTSTDYEGETLVDQFPL